MSVRELFKAVNLPVLQNKMYRSREEALASPTGDILLVEDQITGLIYNGAFDPRKMVYDDDYQNEQAVSGIFKKHLDDVTSTIRKHMGTKTLLEVGCGKGYFLEHLHGLGFDVRGIDPAYEGNNKNIIKEKFNKDLGLKADGIIMRHVLEHIPDPCAFLKEIAEANSYQGKIYIEVPCFDWICSHNAWFDVFYEHVNYFRLDDFSRMFEQVFESGHVFNGQYLYVVANLATFRPPKIQISDRINFPQKFLSGVDEALSLINRQKRKKHAIWGGASKGVIFSLYLKRAGANIDEVIDINPAKQNKFLAGSGLKVSSPSEALARLSPGDHIFIMNSNYQDEIKNSVGEKFQFSIID